MRNKFSESSKSNYKPSLREGIIAGVMGIVALGSGMIITKLIITQPDNSHPKTERNNSNNLPDKPIRSKESHSSTAHEPILESRDQSTSTTASFTPNQGGSEIAPHTNVTVEMAQARVQALLDRLTHGGAPESTLVAWDHEYTLIDRSNSGTQIHIINPVLVGKVDGISTPDVDNFYLVGMSIDPKSGERQVDAFDPSLYDVVQPTGQDPRVGDMAIPLAIEQGGELFAVDPHFIGQIATIS